MEIHVDIYGYEKNKERLMDLSETTVMGSAQVFKLVSAFFSYAASEYEKYGLDFGHEHFRDWCEENNINWNGGDIIAVRDATPEEEVVAKERNN